jgi:hypothetical protein
MLVAWQVATIRSIEDRLATDAFHAKQDKVD